MTGGAWRNPSEQRSERPCRAGRRLLAILALKAGTCHRDGGPRVTRQDTDAHLDQQCACAATLAAIHRGRAPYYGPQDLRQMTWGRQAAAACPHPERQRLPLGHDPVEASSCVADGRCSTSWRKAIADRRSLAGPRRLVRSVAVVGSRRIADPCCRPVEGQHRHDQQLRPHLPGFRGRTGRAEPLGHQGTRPPAAESSADRHLREPARR